MAPTNIVGTVVIYDSNTVPLHVPNNTNVVLYTTPPVDSTALTNEAHDLRARVERLRAEHAQLARMVEETRAEIQVVRSIRDDHAQVAAAQKWGPLSNSELMKVVAFLIRHDVWERTNHTGLVLRHEVARRGMGALVGAFDKKLAIRVKRRVSIAVKKARRMRVGDKAATKRRLEAERKIADQHWRASCQELLAAKQKTDRVTHIIESVMFQRRMAANERATRILAAARQRDAESRELALAYERRIAEEQAAEAARQADKARSEGRRYRPISL